MKTASVTVVIPTFNRAQLLPRAIDSALKQSLSDVEVVVVDDGSTDGTPEVLRGYGNRIIELRQENAGACAARNAGIRAASGDYIQFLDSDDELSPLKLERQMDRVGAADACFCSGVEVDEQGSIRGRLGVLNFGRSLRSLLTGYFCTPSPIIKADLLRRHWFDENLPRAQERDLFLRLAMADFEWEYLDESLFTVHAQTDGISSDRKKSLLGYRDVYVAYVDENRAKLAFDQRLALASVVEQGAKLLADAGYAAEADELWKDARRICSEIADYRSTSAILRGILGFSRARAASRWLRQRVS